MKKLLLFCFLILNLSIQNSYAETLFQHNFETGDEGVFDIDETNTTFSYDTTIKHSGQYSMKLTATDANAAGYARLLPTSANDKVYIRFYIYVPQALIDTINISTEEVWFFFCTAQGWSETLLLARMYNDTGTVGVDIIYNDWGSTMYESMFSADTWHCIELELIRHATTGAVYYWVDGVLINSDVDVDTGDAGFTDFYFTFNNNGAHDTQGSFYIDDIVIDTSNYIGTGYRIQEGVAVGSLPYF